MKPIILDEFKYSLEDIQKLSKEHPITERKDLYCAQLAELYEINYPARKLQNSTNKKKFFNDKLSPNADIRGNWVYFPWNGHLIHTLNSDDYFELRTNRNQLLVSTQEQKRIYRSTVGVLGLSIGSHIAVNLCQQGISKTIKIADDDSIDTTNLNRIRGSLIDVSKDKTVSVQEKIYELNPYNKVVSFGKLTEENLHMFLGNSPRPNVIVEVIDDFKMKVHLRCLARKYRIPVIMLSNVADNIIIDVERYDLSSNLSFFNGLLGNLPEQIIREPNTDPNILAVAMVGKELIPDKALKSVKEIGKTLVGRPQLISTISVSSGIATYMVREILLGNDQIQGRKVLRLDDIFYKE